MQKEKKQKGVSPKADRTQKSMGQWSKKNDKQHLENVWRKQAKFMDNPAKSYGGFQKNDRRQTMIFYSDLYFKTILGYTTPSVQANWTKSVKLRKKSALRRKKSGTKRT